MHSAGLPEAPRLLEVISAIREGTASILAVLSWSPPDGGSRVDQYSLSITPSSLSLSPLLLLTIYTTAALTLRLNVTYDMRVRACNCAGTSEAGTELNNVFYGECMQGSQKWS